MNTMGTRFKLIRKKFDMTQKELADALGVTNAHISKIEKDLTTPSDALIKLLSKLFEISEHWIKTGEEPMMEYDLYDQADDNLSYSTKEFNKLLLDKNPIIRLKTSQLEMIVRSITNIDSLSEDEKIQYLDMLISLFDEINTLMDTFKQYAFDNQLSLIKSDLDQIFTFQLKNINLQFSKFRDLFVEVRNDIELPRKKKEKI